MCVKEKLLKKLENNKKKRCWNLFSKWLPFAELRESQRRRRGRRRRYAIKRKLHKIESKQNIKRERERERDIQIVLAGSTLGARL